MLILPAKTRVRFDNVDNRWVITIPPTRTWMVLPIGAFLLFWLGGWAAGEISAIKALLSDSVWSKGAFNPGAWFLIFWLCAWTLGGGAAVFALLHLLFGQEIITLDIDRLSIRKTVGPFGLSKEYLLKEMKHLRHDVFQKRTRRGLTYLSMSMAFDYGMKTIRFGNGLESPEAEEILTQIRTRTSAYKDLWPSQ